MIIKIQCLLYPGENGFFCAETIDYPVVTQGKSPDETFEKLKEAWQLFVDGEDVHSMFSIPSEQKIYTFRLLMRWSSES